MFYKVCRVGGLVCLSAATLLADFSYEQTAKITGGMMAGMMKFAGAFSKEAREPIVTTTVVKGDKMAHISPHRISVIDLSAETITEIDLNKKTYSVITFADMQKALQQMAERMSKGKSENPDAQVEFKASVEKTGQTKSINGFNTSEAIMKLKMEGTDQKTGQTGGMTITNDMWLAPKVAGYDEVRNFQRRMAEKLAWTPGGMNAMSAMMMQNPNSMKGMADLAKEMSKIDGIPVYQVMKMGAEGVPQNGAAGSGDQQQAQPQKSASEAAGESGGGILGRKLGGGLGGLAGGALGGGFGRKKKQQQEEQAQNAPPQQPQDASGALMEMTMEMTSFSSGPVDASKFAVPAGFKQVENDMEKQLKRGR